MSLIDVRTTRVLFTVLVFTLALGFLYIARRTLIAFLFAIFFAYLVDPAVSRVEKWVHGRGRAIAVIYLLLVVLVVTDPHWENLILAQGSRTLRQTDAAFLLTISVGEPLGLFCYKLIAAVIPLPP